MREILSGKKRLTSFQAIIIGFALVILAGGGLLMLPISSQNGAITPFNESLFTAASAVCVTGLVVHDTASYWSEFGQFVILVLIQIGGMGVVTVASSFSLLSGRKISLMQRSTMQEAIGAPKVGGIVKLTSFFIRVTLYIELIGALVMMPVFCKDYGLKGIWMAFFHSISAFCNAGFDLLGTSEAPFVSLTSYDGNVIITVTIMLLIIIGGLGYYTWDDIRKNRYHFKRYCMQSKIIFITTGVLVIVPAIYFFLFEFAEFPFRERVLGSLFQSVTPRTAGFNTVDLTLFSGAGQCIIILLMFIGGSPGSTAGGMKTTTIAVLYANAVAVFKRKDDIQVFNRRIGEDVIKNASTIFMMYFTLGISGALVISIIEKLPLGTCLFEVASAIGTVGLTLGITTELGMVSQLILIAFMFLGRVGGLTLIYATLSKTSRNFSKLPQEKITVG